MSDVKLARGLTEYMAGVMTLEINKPENRDDPLAPVRIIADYLMTERKHISDLARLNPPDKTHG